VYRYLYDNVQFCTTRFADAVLLYTKFVNVQLKTAFNVVAQLDSES